MAIAVAALRTTTMKRRHEKIAGCEPGNACALCSKVIKPGQERMVAIDHERYEFVTEAEAAERGEAVSLFPVGADCQRVIRWALH